MIAFRKACLGLAVVAGILVLICLGMDSPRWSAAAAVVAAVSLAIGLGGVPALAGYQYTGWILAAVVAAMIYPTAFLQWGTIDLRNKWIVLVVVQLVMFGMGTQMSIKDFVGVMKMPWGVVVAVGCQFLVMPLSGFLLTRIFPLPDEIAAGVILIGCCSSGLASNVMCFIAKANLALSITATAITTMIAPIMTPLWMKVLAGRLVEVNFLNMMTEIIKIVIVPIGAALLHDYLKNASRAGKRRVFSLAAIGAVLLTLVALGGWSWLTQNFGADGTLGVELACFVIGAVVFGVIYHLVVSAVPKINNLMPLASMAGIVYFTTVTTAAGRNNLLLVGGVLLVVAMLHNSAGYFFGYWLAKLCRLDGPSCRTVAIEVGLQNGGMASGIAGGMGKLATVGLAAAVFSPWMNISGSVLANYWKKHPVGKTNN